MVRPEWESVIEKSRTAQISPILNPSPTAIVTRSSQLISHSTTTLTDLFLALDAMPWYWWGGNNSDNDPTKSLDPSLKEFLKEQQPRPYVPADPPSKPSSQTPEERPKVQLPDTNAVYDDRPVPPESLYQDGRYAHLWKTYTPQASIEAATSSDMDAANTYRKSRQRAISRASLENCAFEKEIQHDCLTGKGARKMMDRIRGSATLCAAETQQHTRCYQLQAKFLQALGYCSEQNTTEEHEERIQMHADKLYHRMMDYEADVEDAKRNNRPIPPLASIFNPNRPAPTVQELKVPEDFEVRTKKPLSEFPAHEQELHARAALAEINMRLDPMGSLSSASRAKIIEERKQRQDLVAKISGEPIAKYFIPDARPVKEEGK
jgi:hypothetical protein